MTGTTMTKAQSRVKRRTQLKCPQCDKRLIDTDDVTKSRVEKAKPGITADYYLKCRFCGSEIAIHTTA